jgi:hypothetical protein
MSSQALATAVSESAILTSLLRQALSCKAAFPATATRATETVLSYIIHVTSCLVAWLDETTACLVPRNSGLASIDVAARLGL